MTLLSAMLTLFLVMDPLGNIPLFLVLLEDVSPERRRRILVRESTIALGFLMAFLFVGPYILGFLGISRPALGIAGGLVLFLISLRMIFPVPEGMLGPTNPEGAIHRSHRHPAHCGAIGDSYSYALCHTKPRSLGMGCCDPWRMGCIHVDLAREHIPASSSA